MRVSVASFSATHPFDLARELHAAGALDSYYSALPRFRLHALPPSHTISNPLLLLPQFAVRRLGLAHLEPRLSWTAAESFDRWLSRRQRKTDVLHVASGYGLRAIRRAKTWNALTVCDRGSSHIRAQAEMLRDEFARWDMEFPGVDPRYVAKEEAEYREADVITVPSGIAARSFVGQGIDPAKVVTVPYGVRLDEYYPVPKRDAVFRILCVAALSIRKGIGYLLNATRDLNARDIEVVLRGTPLPETRHILARHEGRFRLSLPIARRVKAGAVGEERAELRDLYSQASVLVLPSVEEGLALVMGQAMACGVPVIATKNTGAEDLVTDGTDGFIVPIRDPAAIRERLEYLYAHPAQREAMGRAALDTVRRMNGWERYGRRMLDMYRERLGARGL